MINYNFLIVGTREVGKTSILNQFCHNLFIKKYKPTFNYNYFSNEIIIRNKNIKFNLWDTGGQTTDNFYISEILLKETNVIILVYDICNINSFENLNNWIIQIKNMKNYNKNSVIMLVGNKNDLENREVHYSEAEKISRDNKTLFMEISSINKNNVDYLFEKIIDIILKEDDDVNCYNRYC